MRNFLMKEWKKWRKSFLRFEFQGNQSHGSYHLKCALSRYTILRCLIFSIYIIYFCANVVNFILNVFCSAHFYLFSSSSFSSFVLFHSRLPFLRYFFPSFSNFVSYLFYIFFFCLLIPSFINVFAFHLLSSHFSFSFRFFFLFIFSLIAHSHEIHTKRIAKHNNKIRSKIMAKNIVRERKPMHKIQNTLIHHIE